MAFQIVLVVLAAAFLIAPHWISGDLKRTNNRAQRLAEIQAGAPEGFFEERRELETYPLVGKSRIYRIIGAVVMIFALTSLAFGK